MSNVTQKIIINNNFINEYNDYKKYERKIVMIKKYSFALAGNPNVGKSTVFNALTGLKQHTGNWAGKTVECAQGKCRAGGGNITLTDLPGTYSLTAHSAEEKTARDYICFGGADCVIVVCSADCLERNLTLALQVSEITDKLVVAVNMLDEAKKRGVSINLAELEKSTGIAFVGISARKKRGLDALIAKAAEVSEKGSPKLAKIRYTADIEKAIEVIEKILPDTTLTVSRRFAALKLLENDEELIGDIEKTTGKLPHDSEIIAAERERLCKNSADELIKTIASCVVLAAEEHCMNSVIYRRGCSHCAERRLDGVLTCRFAAIPIMLGFLMLIFWITIVGANYPSQLLSDLFAAGGEKLTEFFSSVSCPEWLQGMLLDGVYSVLTWVVAVMLPPMAIFFPLFTLLEDFGFLPRVAFNLDCFFKKANACGKQALTMMMGFGCNACGVTGARIIDSPRERLTAIITNSFVPCNGRFPTLIAIITMFLLGGFSGFIGDLLSVGILTAVIVFSVGVSLFISWLLSKTILKGVPSSFTLELPPYRKPQIGSVIVRSVLDRTLFVLGRAVVVAIPAGVFIWLTANINIDGASLLSVIADFLDPFGRILGMDGMIILAFILGFPANEIVIPIIIMGYMSTGTLTDISDLSVLHKLLVDNGWTVCTAISTMLFVLMHFPCSTTCMTVYKETRSLKWTAAAFAVPLACGICVCFLFNLAAGLFV